MLYATSYTSYDVTGKEARNWCEKSQVTCLVGTFMKWLYERANYVINVGSIWRKYTFSKEKKSLKILSCKYMPSWHGSSVDDTKIHCKYISRDSIITQYSSYIFLIEIKPHWQFKARFMYLIKAAWILQQIMFQFMTCSIFYTLPLTFLVSLTLAVSPLINIIFRITTVA